MFLTEADGSPAPVMPVTEAVEHLRLGHGFADDGSEDALVERYLRSAMAAVERRIGQALIRRRFAVSVSRWDRTGRLAMPLGPVEAIVSAELDTGAGPSALSIEGWTVEPCAQRPRLSRNGGALAPIPRGGRVRIVFEAGLAADWPGVPADLREAVLLLAAEFYERRGTEHVAAAGFPGPVASLLAPHMALRV